MNSVSAIILTRNRLPKLQRCLELLVPQLAAGDAAVVIDTGSTDATVDFLRRHPSQKVKVFQFAGEGSWAEARNFGVSKAGNPLVAFLDDDCYVAPGWIERGKRGLGSHEALGGFVAPYKIESWPNWWDEQMGWLVGLSVPGHLGPDAGRVYYPFTANLWARASVLAEQPFQEVGGTFHEREGDRYQTGREDAEWWKRIRRCGYRTGFDAALKVEHDFGAERLTYDYLTERARRDGESWALREGTEGDLEPIAYQYWRFASGIEEERVPQTAGQRRFRALMKIRNDAALAALAEKLSGDIGRPASAIQRRALGRAGMSFLWHRSKSMGRRLLLALNPPRQWPLPEGKPERIAIVAFGFLGDMVILQSCLRGLVHRNPQMKISLLAPQAAGPIFDSLPAIDLTLLPQSMPVKSDARNLLNDWLKKANPEVVFAPYLHGPWAVVFVRMRRPAIPIITFNLDEGLDRRMDRDRIVYKVRKELAGPESQNLTALFARCKIDAPAEPPVMEPSAEGQAQAERWREGLPASARDSPLLMINPDANWPRKEWTPEAWVEATALLENELPHTLVWNLSRAQPDFEKSILDGVSTPERIVFLREAPLDLLIAILAQCEGLLTVDTGPQHLAHALGIPSLTLYGSMDENRWGDRWRRPIHQTLRKGHFDLTPEETRGLPKNHLMTLITPEMVIEQVRDWKSHLKAQDSVLS